MPGGPAGPHGQRRGYHAERHPARRQGKDGPAAAQTARYVGSVHLAHAGSQHPDRRGPDRSAVQLEREAAGADAAAAGAVRQARQAGARGSAHLAGDAGGDGRHHALAREFLHEEIRTPRVHQLQARAEGQQLAAHRRAARLSLRRRDLLVVAGLAAAAWAAHRLERIVLMLILAMFFAYVIAPLVQGAEQPLRLRGRSRRLPRWAAISVVYMLLAGAAVAATVVLWPTAAQQIDDAVASGPAYAESFRVWERGWTRSYERLRIPIELRRGINESALGAGDAAEIGRAHV